MSPSESILPAPAGNPLRAEDLQDVARLSESLLVRIMDMAGSQSGAVWVVDQNQAFQGVCTRGKQKRQTPIDLGEVIHRHEEIFRGTPFFEQRQGKVVLDSLFLPVVHHDLLVGLVHLLLRSAL